MFPLFALTLAQQFPINPQLPAACKTALNDGLKDVTKNCGSKLFDLGSILTDPWVASLCSDQCRISAGATMLQVYDPCKAQRLLDIVNLSADDVINNFGLVSDVGCSKDGKNYCAPKMYQALMKNGLSLLNPSSFPTAAAKLLDDKTFACSKCSTQSFAALQANSKIFGAFGDTVKQVSAKMLAACKSGNKNAAKF